MTRWEPCEKPFAGPLGSGAHETYDGVKFYSTPPSRPYVVFGFIRASSGLWRPVRAWAANTAEEVKADALVLVKSESYSSGGVIWQNGVITQNYGVNARYAAIKWVKKNRK